MGNITLPPVKNTLPDLVNKRDTDERKISAVINKGGSPTRAPVSLTAFKNFNIRILENELERINQLRELRPKGRGQKRPGISLHDWIIEAIQEKLEKESRKYNT